MKTVLVDMDGTLTEPRKKIDMNMCAALAKLQRANIKIGIVTGSDMEYIREQCDLFWDMSPVNPEKITYYPCNGTKLCRYSYTGSGHQVVYQKNMKDKLGIQNFNAIIYMLFNIQHGLQYTQWGKELPLAGKFVDCRGSMINYCPIGRSANSKERDEWIKLDKEYDIRKIMLKGILSSPIFDNVVIKLGGDTSFDIFPHGWDKSYIMRNFTNEDEIYFVGDKCEENGNDKELYDVILSQSKDRAFKTTGPLETINIIEELILA